MLTYITTIQAVDLLVHIIRSRRNKKELFLLLIENIILDFHSSLNPIHVKGSRKLWAFASPGLSWISKKRYKSCTQWDKMELGKRYNTIHWVYVYYDSECFWGPAGGTILIESVVDCSHAYSYTRKHIAWRWKVGLFLKCLIQNWLLWIFLAKDKLSWLDQSACHSSLFTQIKIKLRISFCSVGFGITMKQKYKVHMIKSYTIVVAN